MLDKFYRVRQRDRKIVHFGHTSNPYVTICGHKPTSERYWEAEVSQMFLVYTGDKICKKCKKALAKAKLI